jgi:uncharacterized phage protein (TIGR01671 family)
MKREILFRALRADGKGWVYGDLIQWKSKGICAITPQDGNEWSNCYDFEVIPETVGQFTGLLDKNGTKIFEGDVVVPTKFKDLPNVVKYVSHGFYRFKQINGKQYLNILGSCEVMVIDNIHEQTEQ